MEKTGLRDYVIKRLQGERYGEAEELETVLIEVFALFGFGLREEEQAVGRLNVILRTSYKSIVIPAPILVFLLCLKTVNPRFFGKILSNNAQLAEILASIERLDGGKQFLEGNVGTVLEAELVFALGNSLEERFDLGKYKSIIENASASIKEKDRAESILYRIRNMTRYSYSKFLPDLLRRIELGMDFS